MAEAVTLHYQVDQPTSRPPALRTVITGYQISSDNSNSQKTNCWLQINKQIAIRLKSANKSENHHKHNVCATTQECYHYAHCYIHMQ